MRPVDEATLRVSRRVDTIDCADGPPVLWTDQIARYMDAALWLLASRERR